MTDCERMQDLFVEALYGELNGAERQVLDAHLKGCGTCAEEFAGMEQTLGVMSQRVRPEPGSGYWKDFDEKLQARIETSKPAAKIIPFRSAPAWVWQVAAAVILVALGVVLGRLYVPDRETPVQAKHQTAPVPVQPVPQMVSADPETRRFLERSEVLLLGVVNTNPTDEDADPLDLAHQRQVSHELIQEATLIKDKLEDSKQRRLRELVSDLQLILLQIATLETKQDQPEIEILKNGIDRKGLLLKIDLEQMRLSQPKPEKPAADPKKKDPSI